VTPGRRLVLVGAGGILLLGALAIAVIVLVMPDAAPWELGPVPSPGPATGSPAPPGGLAGIPRPPDLPPPPLIQDPPPPRPAEDSWEAVTPAARPASAGPAGPALGRDLNELQPRLSACFEEDRQALHGRDTVTRTQDFAPMEDTGTTVLMLQVETSPGQVRIVDAPVETQGRASDGLVACAQGVLRGHVLRTPDAKASGRYRVLFTLMP
jgi:hypothetical protein